MGGEGLLEGEERGAKEGEDRDASIHVVMKRLIPHNTGFIEKHKRSLSIKLLPPPSTCLKITKKEHR